MPVRPARVGRVGVIGAPVAKTAVVAKAVTPSPAPLAKTAVVAAAAHRGAVGGSSLDSLVRFRPLPLLPDVVEQLDPHRTRHLPFCWLEEWSPPSRPPCPQQRRGSKPCRRCSAGTSLPISGCLAPPRRGNAALSLATRWVRPTAAGRRRRRNDPTARRRPPGRCRPAGLTARGRGLPGQADQDVVDPRIGDRAVGLVAVAVIPGEAGVTGSAYRQASMSTSPAPPGR